MGCNLGLKLLLCADKSLQDSFSCTLQFGWHTDFMPPKAGV